MSLHHDLAALLPPNDTLFTDRRWFLTDAELTAFALAVARARDAEWRTDLVHHFKSGHAVVISDLPDPAWAKPTP
jgi:hypothetical protein